MILMVSNKSYLRNALELKANFITLPFPVMYPDLFSCADAELLVRY